MVAATNDVIQLLASRTAIASSRLHISTTTSGATYAGTSNWVDLGASDPGSTTFEATKEIVDVMTGSPMTIKQRHITQYNGTVSAEILDYTDNALNAQIGTLVGSTITSPMGWTDTVVAAGASTRSLVYVADVVAGPIAAGDHLAFELGNASYTWFETRRVLAVAVTASPIGTVTLQGQLSEIPAVGADVKKVASVANIIGGNSLREYQLRMINSFNDGSTMVLHVPKGNFTGSINPNYGDSASPVRIPLEFGMIGTPTTVGGFTCDQVTLATHYAYYATC